jgi:hypothetical protein
MASTTDLSSFDLARGEQLLWVGAPRQGVVFRSTDTFLIPFSILWTGFAVFWEASVVKTHAPWLFVLWGIPFIAIGAYITVGRFFADSVRRGRTVYALTSQRVMIRSGTNTRSLALETLSDMGFTESTDGVGTITFGPTLYSRNLYGGALWTGAPATPSFEQIPEARKVFDKIRAASAAQRSLPATAG